MQLRGDDLYRLHDEARDAARDLATRAGSGDLVGPDATAFNEYASAAEHLRDLIAERDSQMALLRAAAEGKPGNYRIEPGSPRGHDRHDTSRKSSRDGAEGQARRVVDSLHTRGLLPDHGAETAEELAGRDRYARDWITAAGDDAYTRAFGKLLVDPARGHMRWDAEEAAAFRRVEALRDSQRAMSLTDSAGGHMVPVALDPAILLTNAGSTNPIRQIARTVTITSDTWNGVSSAGATAEWLAEASEAADGSPTLAQPTVPVHKYSCFVPYSVEIEGDGLNFVSELQKVMADAVDNLHATAFTTGSGSGQPTGIITALAASSPSVVVSGTGSEALAASDFYALQNALGPRFQPNAAWAANLAIINTARQFETSAGALKFPSLQDTPPTLLSRPVHEVSAMDGTLNPSATESNHVVVYGDWSQYVIADRIGTTVEIVNHIVGTNRRPTGQRGVWVWGRVGADSVNDNAFRMLNVSTTV